ncbi:MAG: hypothetical protein JF603_03820 [Acidobacteria bacterium]|nr:hypothetical protein [Acidobacteriota bacterium]
MPLKVGTRLRSAVCTTEVIIVRAPSDDVALACGGTTMLQQGEDAPAGATLDAGLSGGSPLGKRFASDDLGIEVLVTKAGDGTLTVNGEPLPLKEAKALPTSD